jgi:hypothetical protein
MISRDGAFCKAVSRFWNAPRRPHRRDLHVHLRPSAVATLRQFVSSLRSAHSQLSVATPFPINWVRSFKLPFHLFPARRRPTASQNWVRFFKLPSARYLAVSLDRLLLRRGHQHCAEQKYVPFQVLFRSKEKVSRKAAKIARNNIGSSPFMRSSRLTESIPELRK